MADCNNRLVIECPRILHRSTTVASLLYSYFIFAQKNAMNLSNNHDECNILYQQKVVVLLLNPVLDSSDLQSLEPLSLQLAPYGHPVLHVR